MSATKFNYHFNNLFGHLFAQLDNIGIEVDSCDSAEEALAELEKLSINDVGVFLRWNNCTFPSQEDAIDQLRDDDNAVCAAFNGWIKFEDCPHIQNCHAGTVADSESCGAFTEMRDWVESYDDEDFDEPETDAND